MHNTTMIIKHKFGAEIKKGELSFNEKVDNMLAQGYTLKHLWYTQVIGGLHEAHFYKEDL